MLCLDCNCQDHSNLWLYAKQRYEVNKGHEFTSETKTSTDQKKTNIPPQQLAELSS